MIIENTASLGNVDACIWKYSLLKNILLLCTLLFIGLGTHVSAQFRSELGIKAGYKFPLGQNYYDVQNYCMNLNYSIVSEMMFRPMFQLEYSRLKHDETLNNQAYDAVANSWALYLGGEVRFLRTDRLTIASIVGIALPIYYSDDINKSVSSVDGGPVRYRPSDYISSNGLLWRCGINVYYNVSENIRVVLGNEYNRDLLLPDQSYLLNLGLAYPL